MDKETNSRPVFESRHRSIRVSTYKNRSKDGKSEFYNTQLVRRYQSGQDEWTNSSYFTGESDLVLARDLIDKALDFIRRQEMNPTGLELV